MNLTGSLVFLCAGLPFVGACGGAAVGPAQGAHKPRGGPESALGPATVVSVPEPSPEAVQGELDASDDQEVPAHSAPRLARYAGQFYGALMSTGEMVPAVTRLRWQEGALTGDYAFGDELDERGTLHDCSEREPNIVRCEWRDEYGTGALKLGFSSSTSTFEGEWSTEAEPELWHPWVGARFAEVEQSPDASGPDAHGPDGP